MTIPVSAVRTGQEHAPPYEPPYRWFLAAALVLAIGGGFALGALAALQRALEWDWDFRSQAAIQAHGQLQLLGWGGLFTAGMSLRLMPRFSGRPLAFRPLVRWLIPLIGGSLILRATAQIAGGVVARDAVLVLSALMLLAGALALTAIVWRTLVHPDSRGEATTYFFCAGTLGFVAAAVLNLDIVLEMVRDDLDAAANAKQLALVFIEQYGFTLMFICGVSMRAVPSLTGRPRPNALARAAAVVLVAGNALFAGALLYAAYDAPTKTSMRIGDAGLVASALALLAVVWMTGVFHPRANRVAAASQTQFWFVRCGMAWLAVAAALSIAYAARAFADARMPDAYALDAVRHLLAVGVLTLMILGMAMLIVPEFAGRRLQHPKEAPLIMTMLIAINIAVSLRAWPAIAGVDWYQHTRYWPMAAAGGLAEAVVVAFGLMFAQSYREQRKPGWAKPQALQQRGSAPVPIAPPP